jgi:DNA-binding CsgD family transcriptional regulator
VAVSEFAVGGAGFVGRSHELTVIAGLVEEATTGRPWVVWLEGEAGSGKTILVRQALAGLAATFTAVQAAADEFAVDVPYELAGQLGALHTDDPFAAGMDMLNSWSAAQDNGPVVVVIEDLHWADLGSRRALLSAVRRLDKDRVVVVITARPGVDDGWERFRMNTDRCRPLLLADFDIGEVAALAATAGVELSYGQAERLHAHTQGHPLWVRMLLGELSAAQLRAADGDLPAPRSLASSVTARLSELPADARTLASAMAVINQRSPLPMVGQVAGLAAPVEPFEVLLDTGLVGWDPNEPGPPVEFTHPLYRRAVYQDLSPTTRRDLHQAVAAVLTPASVLAHRVAAADGVDDGLADELEVAAWRELHAGTAAVGARNLLWASSLSRSSEQAERRLLEAVRALLDSSQILEASGLRGQVEACRDSPTRSLVLGIMDWELGEAARAERLLRAAALAAPSAADWGGAGWAWAQLAEIYATQSRAQDTIDAANRALALSESGPRVERLAWICLAVGEGLLHGAVAGLERMRQRLPQGPDQVPDREANMLVTRGTLGLYAGRVTSAISDHRAVLRAARRTSVYQLARCHFQMAMLLVAIGEWDEAVVHARTAISVAADHQQVWYQAQCQAVQGMVLAYRGDWDLAAGHVTAAQTRAASHDSLEAVFMARVAAAALAQAQGRPERVIEALGDLPPLVPMMSGLTFWPTLIVAVIQSGQLHWAEELLAGLQEAAAARALDFEARLSALRARLALGHGHPDEAAGHFETALASFGADDPFLERALTHHAYGQLLRARGRRRQAVTELRTAHQLLSSVRANPFLAGVDAELESTGIRPASRPTRSTLELTDRERDVAVLVAQGLSNPEVAEQLYISRKAVEYHLRNTYGKLGITSRKELRTIQL